MGILRGLDNPDGFDPTDDTDVILGQAGWAAGLSVALLFCLKRLLTD
jgi:hypothetical protein